MQCSTKEPVSETSHVARSKAADGRVRGRNSVKDSTTLTPARIFL
jgi:hypothetical protein